MEEDALPERAPAPAGFRNIRPQTKPPEAMRRTAPPAYMDSYKEAFVEETAAFIHSYDLAHVTMLGERGILPAEIALGVLRGLAGMQERGMAECRRAAGGGNHAAEKYLTQVHGSEIGGAIGLARSSGDLSAISFRMYARDQILGLREGILGLREALAGFAREHAEVVLPGNTHGQHAQPITVALWAMMYHDALARDGDRLAALCERVNFSPAGAGIMSGTEFPIDRRRVAEFLGFDGVVANTLDAALSHDLEMEFASVLNLLCYTLSRMAEDLFLWATTEYSLITLPDWFIGISSMMPQKRNPDGVQDLRNLSAQSQAVLAMVQGTERGPTGFPIIERRNSDRMLRGLVVALRERLEVLPDLLADMVVNAGRAEDHANAYWAAVTDLAGALVRINRIEWRRAHNLVAGFVRDCIEQGISPTEVTAEDFNAYASRSGAHMVTMDDATLTKALDARAFVRRRETFGGPGPAAMDQAIRSAGGRMRAEAQAIAGWRGKLAAAEARLQASVQRTLAENRFA
ncbi:argininosuccinate lyase [Poseidonocella sp. HB161398]|uniref:argininosuccinate lyase n=1 Tax=Poseidonocella sp. HB161398 TaxID=2320855 RepID=UPI00148728A9|nr:argininosuccinate lyase [Poseidonocella sp. HB161398]